MLDEISQVCIYTVKTKHLYNICTMLEQRQTLGRHCTNAIQMFFFCSHSMSTPY